MKKVTPLVLVSLVGLGAMTLGGCQDNGYDTNSKRPANMSGTTYNNGGPAGIPDNPNGASTGVPQGGNGAGGFGNENHSGTLGGGTIHDPNANTSGGGF